MRLRDQLRTAGEGVADDREARQRWDAVSAQVDRFGGVAARLYSTPARRARPRRP